MAKYLVMDVDGTLTDGKIYMSDKGEAFKAFNAKDGYGLRVIAIPAGITPVIITGRTSGSVSRRAEEIGITEVHQGIDDKTGKLLEITDDFSRVAYIGDDINDLPCMKAVKAAGGIIGCPRDSVREILELADFVAEHDGGNGAVRDFIEWLLADGWNLEA